MRYLRTNTATIVTVGPFYDKGDGVTIEGSLTITNEKISFVVDLNDGSAPTLVLDNVTGATSGTDNDLNYIANCDAGLMQLELAAANVNYLGRAFLTITDAANHCPVFHEFTILPAMVYDSLIAGTDVLQADMTQLLGTAVSAPATDGLMDVNAIQLSGDATAANNAESFFDGTGYAGTNNVIPTVTTLTGHTAQTADVATLITTVGVAGAGLTALATQASVNTIDDFLDTEIAAILADTNELQTDWANGGRLDVILDAASAPSAATVADAVWDEALAGHAGAGSAGAALSAAGTAGDPWSTALPGAYGAGTAGNIIGGQGATGAGLTAIPWNATWDAEVQSEVADALEATIADSVPADGAMPSIKQALYMIAQRLLDVGISGTTMTVYKPDGATALYTITLSDATNPTTMTRTG